VSRRGDSGAATVLVLGIAALVAATAGVLIAAEEAALTRHRAALSADAAALTAAAQITNGAAVACAAAQQVLADDGSRLVSCRPEAPFVVVRAEVEPPRWLRWAGTATGVARAGPDPDAEKTGGVAFPS